MQAPDQLDFVGPGRSIVRQAVGRAHLLDDPIENRCSKEFEVSRVEI
jgi:hypothetical protein